MDILTESYESTHIGYTNALTWMNQIGVKICKGRTQHYEKVLNYWKDEYQTATEEEAKRIFPDFVNSIFEIESFISIFNAFADVPIEKMAPIIDKLNKGVNGPVNAVQETHKSTVARNYLFEVLVAARLTRPDQGIAAILDTPSDTGFKYGKSKFWIECKRVTKESKIEANVRDASKQVESVLKKKIGSGHRGLVALDVTKIINKGDKILVAQNDFKLIESLQSKMDAFINNNAQVWEKVYKRRNRKIIGTIIHISLMASSESRNLLVSASEWGLNPRVGISAADNELQKKLVTFLN